ncbi:hypothetical protein phiB1_1_52 [Pseudomonas phage phiB1_1]|uniref:Uncharacterized protein n=1 Tax=Pseudomonas phage phiB1_1 TaxID=2755402 RepID=A0A7D7F3X6_9CAUD|nr:hypothetical protein phiB1_1_52 [Pseudomonas phage phiB1_1]UAW53693.1 hypothetical protein pphageB21_60 [Pseudomonas phage pphageB21]
MHRRLNLLRSFGYPSDPDHGQLPPMALPCGARVVKLREILPSSCVHCTGVGQCCQHFFHLCAILSIFLHWYL